MKILLLQYRPALFIQGVLLLLASCIMGSCKKYLDLKPDRSYVIPTSLADAQALLDDYTVMNTSYPGDGEAAADNYYLTDVNWTSALVENRDNYIWAPQGLHLVTTWLNPYKVIFNANEALSILDGIDPHAGNNYNDIKGSAYFFKAFALYHVAQLFAKPYDASTATSDPGVPVRLGPEVDIPSRRGTVQQTYDRIILDLKDAVSLLPVTSSVKSRPNKVAAFAQLARVYLAMGDYTQAGIYADSCLKRYNTLLSYASLSATSTTTPFTRFNAEVIFSALTSATATLNPSQAKIDTALYNSYVINDRRKGIFFKANTGVNAGTFAYKGGYDGTSNTSIFIGLATDEVYLVRAECYARAGKTTEAMADLNTLMRNRWTGPFTDFTATNAEEALLKIITERRKELIFRTLRWTDLRRLNKEPRFAKTLNRPMNTMPYTPLAPNDLRYVMLIPNDVINTTGMQQNPR